MRTILVTGSDTGIGKTQVVAALARLLGSDGLRIQIVKVVETGAGGAAEGDADRACRMAAEKRSNSAGVDSAGYTLASFSAPLAPATAAAGDNQALSLELLAERAAALPACDWRIYEGAGGIATPVDGRGHDWTDFASTLGIDATVIVVPDRLGAINQARLAYARAAEAALHAGIWLNAAAPVEARVAGSNREGLRVAGVPVWAEMGFGAGEPVDAAKLLDKVGRRVPTPPRSPEGAPTSSAGVPTSSGLAGAVGTRRPTSDNSSGPDTSDWTQRFRAALAERDRLKQRRTIRVTARKDGALNLADNDYLDLARDPAVAAAAVAAAAEDGTSASASPLITGWRRAHARLVEALCAWHRFPSGLLWNSGYAANSAVLGTLPRSGDRVLADRLIHHSMIAGLQRSGARLQRYAHLDLNELERRLEGVRSAESDNVLGTTRSTFVITESVFSMDGDYPDMVRLAELKRRFGFCWILDEAHALGWYGPEGSGLARAAGVEASVDVLVGTLGKTLAAGGAYTLFRDEAVRDYLVNFAGEFIYSTALPPTNAAAAEAALRRVRALSAGQAEWQRNSRAFRAALRAEGWAAAEGDSPIVPVRLEDENAALALADALRTADVHVAAVRPPTVPAGTSRLRFSLKRTFTPADGERVLAVMRGWRGRDRL